MSLISKDVDQEDQMTNRHPEDHPRNIFQPHRKIKVMRVFTHEFRRMEEIERYLAKLHQEMKDAVDKGDSAKSQATAYNIINVMRELEAIEHEKKLKKLKFQVRDIVTHATKGTLDKQEALEKIKSLI